MAVKGKRRCSGQLRDQVLDWDDALPPKELRAAERHSREASLSLVLGSSLQIIPSCNLPLKTVRGGKGKLAIVNLQKTGKDKKADVVIHEKTDIVMVGLMRRLGLAIPEYVHSDTKRQWDKTFRPLKVDEEDSAKRARVK